jgi:hypothetical protein
LCAKPEPLGAKKSFSSLDLRPASPSLAALGLRPCCSLQHQRTQGSFFDVLSSEEQLPSATALDRRNLSRTIALLRHSSNYGPRHKVGHLCSRYTGMRRRNGLYSHATINRVLFVRGVDISAIKQFEEAMLVRERHNLSPTTTLCGLRNCGSQSRMAAMRWRAGRVTRAEIDPTCQRYVLMISIQRREMATPPATLFTVGCCLTKIRKRSPYRRMTRPSFRSAIP